MQGGVCTLRSCLGCRSQFPSRLQDWKPEGAEEESECELESSVAQATLRKQVSHQQLPLQVQSYISSAVLLFQVCRLNPVSWQQCPFSLVGRFPPI